MGLFGYAEEWEAQPTVWILVSTSVHACTAVEGDILRARNRSSDRIAMALIIRIVTAHKVQLAM